MKPYVRTGLAWSVPMILIMCAIAVWGMVGLPDSDEIPLHWNTNGEADRFGTRQEAMLYLWAQPALAAFITALLAIMPTIDPRHKNVDAGRTAYVVVWVGVMILMAAISTLITLAMVRSADGQAGAGLEMIRYIIGGVSVLMIVMGNYLPKTRASFTFGIRTPWTLSSDDVWEKTHRVAGPLMMLAGVAGLLGGLLLDGGWIVAVLTAGILSVTVFSVAYSYILFRREGESDTV